MSQKEQERQEADPSSIPWYESLDPYTSSLPWDEQVELEEKRFEEMENENLMNRERIKILTEENERKSAELEELSYQLQEKQGIIEEKQRALRDEKNQKLQEKLDEALEKIKDLLQKEKKESTKGDKMVKKIQALQVKLDESLKKNEEIFQENKQLVIKLTGTDVHHKVLKGRVEFLEKKVQQTMKQEDKDCKLQDIEKHSKGLQIKLDEALQKNKEILQEKKQLVIKLKGTDKHHKVLKGRVEFLEKKVRQTMKQEDKDCKLQDIEKHSEGLQIKLDEALQKNKELLQEKEKMDIKLTDTEKDHKVLQARAQALCKEIWNLVEEKKEQYMKQNDLNCKLQSIKEHNKDLQIKLDVALQKNKKLLQEVSL